MKLLLVEDDEVLVKQLSSNLAQVGYHVDSATDGEEGLYRAREFTYDLIIVDLGLPKISGIGMIEQLRADELNTPILILTARSSWQDKVNGLNTGADDYLVKPFQFEEMHARVQALLRRAGGYSTSELKKGPICLNIETHEISVDGRPVSLTAFEHKLIHYFMLHPKKVASKSTLADYLYEEDFERDSNVIEVLVGRLRQKLDPENSIKPIETLRGRGYRFAIE